MTGPRRPVDLGRVRAALATLDRVAREHPELVDHNAANVAAWEAALPDILEPQEPPETMAAINQHQQSFRFPDELIARIDAYAEALERETGLQVSRNDALRSLVVRALKAIDAEGGNVLAPAVASKPSKARKGAK